MTKKVMEVSETVSEGTSSGSSSTTEGRSVSKTVQTASAVAQTAVSKRGPVKSFHEGDVWCNVFAFPNKSGTHVNYSVTLSRSYKDSATGKWKSTSFFGANDMGIVMGLAKQAGDYITGLQYPQPEGPLED